MIWTRDRLEKAKSMWASGVPVHEIADCFGLMPSTIYALASNRRADFPSRSPAHEAKKGSVALAVAKDRSDAIREARRIERERTLERLRTPRKIDMLRERDLGMGAG